MVGYKKQYDPPLTMEQYEHEERGFICHRYPQPVDVWSTDWCGEYRKHEGVG